MFPSRHRTRRQRTTMHQTTAKSAQPNNAPPNKHFDSTPRQNDRARVGIPNMQHSPSPLKTTHSSRAFLVSGQQQQIFLPDLIPTLSDFLHSPPLAGAAAGAEALFPMVRCFCCDCCVAGPVCISWLVSGPECLSQSDPDFLPTATLRTYM